MINTTEEVIRDILVAAKLATMYFPEYDKTNIHWNSYDVLVMKTSDKWIIHPRVDNLYRYLHSIFQGYHDIEVKEEIIGPVIVGPVKN